MPLALLALMLSAFAIGTTEFVIVGLIPTMAADLNASLQALLMAYSSPLVRLSLPAWSLKRKQPVRLRSCLRG